MHFSDILDLHESFRTADSIPAILGDGYLLRQNPVYRKIRERSLKQGATYIEAYPEYLLLPFHELPRILSEKKVPYVPGARLVEKIEQSWPAVFETGDLAMPESYHMHEAAHLIADNILGGIKAKNRHEEILLILMSESFANTADALACGFAADEIHHYFLKQNCYMHPRRVVNEALASLEKEAGLAFTFMLIFFTYLQANFLSSALSPGAIRGILRHAGLELAVRVKLRKEIRVVCGIGERLDPLFRVTTTGNFLKQRGFVGDIHDIFGFPFQKTFRANPAFGRAVDELAQVLV